MKNLYDYQVICRRDDNGSYVAYVPALAGCHAIGETPVEAPRELQNVFEMIAEEFAESGAHGLRTCSFSLSMPASVVSQKFVSYYNHEFDGFSGSSIPKGLRPAAQGCESSSYLV